MDQIRKYIFHKRAFDIKDTIYLRLFENLLNDSQDYRLECSCKIEDKKIYPIRFNLWYGNRNCIKSINLIFNFFEKISKYPGITINYNPIKKVFDRNFNLEKAEQIIVGIDYRKNINKSRLKMWFMIRDYPEKMEEVLSIYGHNKDVLDLIIDDKLLFGFDFYFDGRTNIKIYPHLDKRCLKDALILEKLKNIFSGKILRLIGECDELYVSFRGKNYKKVIHFHPRNRELFVEQLKNKKLKEISSLIKDKNFGNKGVVSLCEDEIENNSIKNANIYY